MKTNAAVVGGGRFEPPEAAQVAGVWSTVSPANDWRVLAPRLCVMMFLVSMPSSTKYVLPIVSKATLLTTRRSARVRARSVSNLPAPAPGGRARTARSSQVRWVSLTVNTVDDHRAVVRVVDRIVLDVRVSHGANHVEVDRVAAQPAHLASVSHLDILNARSEAFATRAVDDGLMGARVEHDVSAVPVKLRHRVALDDDIV